ncbi:hypothetical protein BC826DRAFT_439599 [Russula brevipes]|nr:hypothetical protein BC826DRAFT_439599 [Russula brevipes]
MMVWINLQYVSVCAVILPAAGSLMTSAATPPLARLLQILVQPHLYGKNLLHHANDTRRGIRSRRRNKTISVSTNVSASRGTMSS